MFDIFNLFSEPRNDILEYTSKKEDIEFLTKRLKQFYNFDDDKKDSHACMFSVYLHSIAKKYKGIVPLEDSDKCSIAITQEVVQKLSNITPFINFPQIEDMQTIDKIYPFRHYILNENHEVKESSLMEWGAFFKDPNPLRRVKRTPRLLYNQISVYTSFLGMEHEGGMFETMAFSDYYLCFNEICTRCNTYDEAIKQHDKVCNDILRSFRN